MNGRGVLFGCVAVLLGAVAFLELVFPHLAQAIAGAAAPLPVPRTLLWWYLGIIAIGEALYVLSSDAALASFLDPLRRAARGELDRGRQALFAVALGLIPVIAGIGVYGLFAVDATPPAVARQQHPGMSSASAAAYQGVGNPLRAPTAEMLVAFADRYAALEAPDDPVDARPPPRDFAALGRDEQLAVFRDVQVREGRALYARSCTPCHGAKLDGDGHASYAWSLPAIDFREPGTIETLVEDAVLWRVAEGGLGLPPIATPWDSVMPRWKDDLTQEQMWQVIMAVYADSGVEPRVLELRHEEAP